MNINFAKIIALAIVGGVAKALFGPPPVVNNYNTTPEKTDYTKPTAVKDNDE